MSAMKPVPGVTGAYFNAQLSLTVEVISYKEIDEITERIGLRVLKNNTPNLDKYKYRYEEGDEFVYERRMDGNEKGLHFLLTLD